MSHNTFGHLFRVTTWGESHGAALGCVVDGCPPGIRFTRADIQAELDRRRPGQSRFVTQRREPDEVKILSGFILDEDGETMSDAETLAGLELRVPVDRLAALPAGTFYRHDLVGCRVETRDGAMVGVVSHVEGTMSGSRLVVDGEAGEVLIPLVGEICTLIDPHAKRIVIDPPAGLIEANARG